MAPSFRQNIWISISIHLVLFGVLVWAHFLKTTHPLARPKILTVQWVTLPAPVPMPQKTEVVPPPQVSKPPVPVPPPAKILPSKAPSKTTLFLPPPIARKKKVQPQPVLPPVTPKIEPVIPKPEPVKAEEPPPPPPEAQKIDMAPISEIDPIYVDRMKRMFEANWNPPQFNGQVRQATVIFEVLRNGMIKNVRILKSSDDRFYDTAAMRTVLETRRFGPLPPDYPSLSVEITCTFTQNKGS